MIWDSTWWCPAAGHNSTLLININQNIILTYLNTSRLFTNDKKYNTITFWTGERNYLITTTTKGNGEGKQEPGQPTHQQPTNQPTSRPTTYQPTDQQPTNQPADQQPTNQPADQQPINQQNSNQPTNQQTSNQPTNQ